MAPKDLETGLLVLEVVHSADTEITPYNNLQLHVRHPNKYGENLYMSSGRAAQEQAQGAVDSWYGLKV